MKNNVHEMKKPRGKKREPNVFIPRFIRIVRTPHSERYSVVVSEQFEPIGMLDVHVAEVLDATLVIFPNVEQELMDLLITLVKIELILPLDLEVRSFHVYKGVAESLSFDEEDLFGDDTFPDDEDDEE